MKRKPIFIFKYYEIFLMGTNLSSMKTLKFTSAHRNGTIKKFLKQKLMLKCVPKYTWILGSLETFVTSANFQAGMIFI